MKFLYKNILTFKEKNVRLQVVISAFCHFPELLQCFGSHTYPRILCILLLIEINDRNLRPRSSYSNYPSLIFCWIICKDLHLREVPLRFRSQSKAELEKRKPHRKSTRNFFQMMSYPWKLSVHNCRWSAVQKEKTAY